MRLSALLKHSAAFKTSCRRRGQRHQRLSPQPRCCLPRFASSNVWVRPALHPPPKLPKLSKPGLAVQQEFTAGIIKSMDNALSALPKGSEEPSKFLTEDKSALASRQKHIRIEDKFDWDTVVAYSEGLVGDDVEGDRWIAGAATLARRVQSPKKRRNSPFRGPRSFDAPTGACLCESSEAFRTRAPQGSNSCFLCGSEATGHERAPSDGRHGKAGETSSLHLLPHGLQQETPSASPKPPGSLRATPLRPPPNDFKPSPACPYDTCATLHPAPSIPQHSDAPTCPIPDALSSDGPNSSTCNTEQVGDHDRLSCFGGK